MIIKNIKELSGIAKLFIKNNKKQIILLIGDLGAGKTTFVQLVGEFLKIKENINSPTFVISKRYVIPKNKKWNNLIHIDAYRLSNKADVENIGLNKDLENNKNLIFIEWGENIEKFLFKKKLQENTQKIFFEYLDKNKRKLIFHK